MAMLTTAQKDFLESQGIPLSRVFDATRMRTAHWKRVMSELDMVVAIGVTPCEVAGHTLRTRAGHCAICKPANLGFLLRYDAPGEVYVARSRRGALTKVGTAKNSVERIRNLNGYEYGGVSDWHVEFYQQSQKAGRVEGETHRILSAYSVSSRTYFKNGGEIVCQEIFSCDVPVAIEAVQKALASVSGVVGRVLNDGGGPKPSKPQQAILSSPQVDGLNKRVFVKRNSSSTEWASNSVAAFAGELGLPTTLLIEQLRAAGVHNKSGEGKMTEHDKTVLLEYLRRAHKIHLNSSGRAKVKTITQELNELDELSNRYFSMPLDELRVLWDNGKNELEGEERELVRIAIRNKSGIT